MSFVLDQPDSKRVKHVDLNGREETEDQGKAALQAALTAALQAAANPGAEAVTDLAHTETQASAAVTPREVLDKLNAAKGELDVVLDLINLLEAQYYLGVANIARPSNVQLEEQERALQLQQKVCQLQDAGSRLRYGATAMRAHAAKHDFFFAQLAQLQQQWTLRRPQLGSGAAGPFQIDVALPLGPKWQLRRDEQQPNAIVDIAEGPDGTLQLLSGGLPVPDVPLRWLRPLHRPSPASSKHAPQQQQQVSVAGVPPDADKQPQHTQSSSPAQEATPIDIAMSEATPSMFQAQASQAVAFAHDAQPQPQVQQDANESVAMAIDSQSEAVQHSATLQNADAKLDVQPMQQLQQQPELDMQQQQGLLLQAPQLQQGQLQMPSGQYHLPELPPDLQEKVHEHVVRCDRQLLGRQEALMARWLPQRIEEEVRAKHGAADIDDSATSFVQQVFSNTSDSSPVLAAVQLRLLQFLLCSNEDEGTDSLLDEVLRLSGQQTQQP